MHLFTKSLFIITLIFLFTSCTNEKIELKKSSYDIKQCNKKTYTNKDLENYKQLIKDNDIQGYNCVGLYYMRDKDYKKAEKYFNQGKEKGNIESYTQLGSLYSNFLNKKDKAIEYYTIAANNGEVKAAHNLGVIYDKKAQYKEALKWYEESFNSGDTYSLLAIGHIYRKQKNYEKAIETFKEATKLGDARGYFNLGIFYDKEKDFIDKKKAYNYFLKCYEMGLGKCAGAIGQGYEENSKDYEKAIEWYKKGFELKSEESVNRLGFIYWEVLKDYEKAIYWFNKGYEDLNCISCLASVGNIYAVSLKDYDSAIKWYKKASNLGYVSSTYNIGYTYDKDLNDKENAIKWYKKAAKMGHENAKYHLKKLGVTYEQ
ncbi:hypothetical protein CRV08_06840 [Halarcobacter ebronensis]|uniref:beta-lactamase n=1 Tax=Halarcobacter ebronensis TaxID=1462615 RepID=A0A4Q0YHH1_9BACT|nr:tetratricopeptide/SEL1-like repeat protein [Halarcobacter ebronensis]RXJ68539.1 hypothetical protein CRV08_06840 [Halarcobacter ebronensis]